MTPKHGLCTTAVLKIGTTLWTSRALVPLNFFGLFLEFGIELLRGFRVFEELLSLRRRFSTSPLESPQFAMVTMYLVDPVMGYM